jgi:hypothetical protein
MQDPDRQKDAPVMDARGVGAIADIVEVLPPLMGLDPVADQQRLVILVGAQPLGHGLVMALRREPAR